MPESGGLEMFRDSNGFWKSTRKRTHSVTILSPNEKQVTKPCSRCPRICRGIGYRLTASGEIVCHNHTKDMRPDEYVRVTLGSIVQEIPVDAQSIGVSMGVYPETRIQQQVQKYSEEQEAIA